MKTRQLDPGHHRPTGGPVEMGLFTTGGLGFLESPEVRGLPPKRYHPPPKNKGSISPFAAQVWWWLVTPWHRRGWNHQPDFVERPPTQSAETARGGPCALLTIHQNQGPCISCWSIPWHSLIWLVVWNIWIIEIVPSIGNHHPNWLSYFSEVGQPPSSYLCERSPIRWCHGAQFLAIQDRRGSVDPVAVSGCHQNAIILNLFNLGWFGVPSILGKLQMNTLKRLQGERWTT